ncbi:MAG: terminase, partial [Dehalococcoidia bacterium]
GELADSTGPRTWQAEAFRRIGAKLQDPATRHQPIRIARVSGHDIGKSAFISILCHWGMSTFEDCRVIVTANTENQLRTKTWPEIRKWFRLAINAHWFKTEATSVFARDSNHPDWRVDAIPWSEHNTEAFQGLHNKGKRIIVIFDEASAIPDKVWDAAEGSMLDEDTEIIWVVFGNGTRASGEFRECFRGKRHRWDNESIDARDVEGTNKRQIEEWLEDNDIDSDFIKVRVRGMFPNQSPRQFFSEADVDAGFRRHLRPEQFEWAPKILTCDPAWEGDDELAIGIRQGLYSKILCVLPKNDNDVEVANILAGFENQEKADAVWIDAGYGTGIASVGKTQGRNWQVVWFSGKSGDPGCLNKKAEMYKRCRDWLKAGGSYDDKNLHEEFLWPESVPRLDGMLQIEPKDAMKRRGLRSPNRLDQLALSFAFPDPIKRDDPLSAFNRGQQGMCQTKYDVFEELDRL